MLLLQLRSGGTITVKPTWGSIVNLSLSRSIVFGFSSGLALATWAASLTAADLGGVAIHGAVSVTAGYSDTYNYYGDTNDRFDLIQKEITLNSGYRFENGLRIGAQLYAFELAELNQLTIDFAGLDYSVCPEFGVRAGRNKAMNGLYDDVQDLDQVRVFASLPLSFYPRSARAFGASFDGLALYGTITAGGAGSFDYQISLGRLEKVSAENPYSKGTATFGQVSAIKPGDYYGAALTWNPRLDGLKLIGTYIQLPEVRQDTFLDTRAALTARGFGAAPMGIDFAFGMGTWDYSGLFAGTPFNVRIKYEVTTFGAEYVRGKWTYVAEWRQEKVNGETDTPALGLLHAPVSTRKDLMYGQVVYQATDRLGLGIYYAYTDGDPKNTNPAPSEVTTSRDTAAAVSFGLTKWWLIKAEIHHINGLQDLNIAGDVNFPTTDRTWNLVVLKSTISF